MAVFICVIAAKRLRALRNIALMIIKISLRWTIVLTVVLSTFLGTCDSNEATRLAAVRGAQLGGFSIPGDVSFLINVAIVQISSILMANS
jgi:hypothetical protein